MHYVEVVLSAEQAVSPFRPRGKTKQILTVTYQTNITYFSYKVNLVLLRQMNLELT